MVNKKEFIVNPHLIEDKRCISEIARDGVVIDQVDFENAVTETNYSKYLVLNGGNLKDNRSR